MVEVRSGIKVVDDAIKGIKKRRCSILVVGKKAAETFTFQLAKSFCAKQKSQPNNVTDFQTIYVNFNDSKENISEKAKRIGWNSKNEGPDEFIDMYDRRSVGNPDNIVNTISNSIARIREEKKKEPVREIVVFVNSLSRLALYLGEDKVLDFLSTMNYLEYPDINLFVFFFLDDSLHESLFISKVRSLVDCAIVFRENYEMEITENFFGLEGFGESATVTKWYSCLDMKEYGIIPVDSLDIARLCKEDDEELKRRVELAEARKVMEYCKREGYLDDDEYENLRMDGDKRIEWMKEKRKKYKREDLKTFRTGIWAIDRLFSDEENILGGIEHIFGIAIVYDIHLVDMYPVFAKIVCRCFEEEKSLIEISTEDNPELFLLSLQYSHGMNLEYEAIRNELLRKKKPKFKFINCYGIEPSEEEFKRCDNIFYTDAPYNITILFSKYRAARESLKKALRQEGDETGPVIWLNSYSNLASVSSVENAYSLGVNTIMAQDVWSPKDKWFSLMLFSMQKGFLSPDAEQTLQQVLDGIIEFKSRSILGNRIYYFRVPKMPKTDKTVAWTPYRIMEEKLGFLSLDEETVYHYLEAGILDIKGRNGK
jgi:KaiC/GvpD/RAD55 family RecA-like ATPase